MRVFSAARRSTACASGDSRTLLKFAAEGYVEQAVKDLSAELARLEASLEVELDGETIPYRQAAVVQANERDPERRRGWKNARNELLDTRLNPLLREMFDRSRELVRELGWPSVRAMTEELSGIARTLGHPSSRTSARERSSISRSSGLRRVSSSSLRASSSLRRRSGSRSFAWTTAACR